MRVLARSQGKTRFGTGAHSAGRCFRHSSTTLCDSGQLSPVFSQGAAQVPLLWSEMHAHRPKLHSSVSEIRAVSSRWPSPTRRGPHLVLVATGWDRQTSHVPSPFRPILGHVLAAPTRSNPPRDTNKDGCGSSLAGGRPNSRGILSNLGSFRPDLERMWPTQLCRSHLCADFDRFRPNLVQFDQTWAEFGPTARVRPNIIECDL